MKESWLIEIRESYFLCSVSRTPGYSQVKVRLRPVPAAPDDMDPVALNHKSSDAKPGFNFARIREVFNDKSETVEYKYTDKYKTRYFISITTFINTGTIKIILKGANESGRSIRTEILVDSAGNEIIKRRKDRYLNQQRNNKARKK